jgi:hypothetical protein
LLGNNGSYLDVTSESWTTSSKMEPQKPRFAVSLRQSQPRSRSGPNFDLEHNGDMKCKVFVSCGQHTEEERQVAREICALLGARGFRVYLAIDVQTILEINERIIRELKNSDCYLFVNFRRDPVGDKFRGSLFSNQEFAIAYALGFERLLVVNQAGVLSEGMLRYIGINTETFRDHDDCCAVVQRALDRAAWAPDYSRRLRASGLRLSEVVLYGNLAGNFLYLDIHNDRPDIAALEGTAKLSAYARSGKEFEPSPISSPLKATARPGFSHTIFPKSHEAFDLLCIGWEVGLQPAAGWGRGVPATSGTYQGRVPSSDPRVYLNSALDVIPPRHLPLSYGRWTLRYQFFAIDFPVLTVDIELTRAQGEPPSVRP